VEGASPDCENATSASHAAGAIGAERYFWQQPQQPSLQQHGDCLQQQQATGGGGFMTMVNSSSFQD
jgi:hypothetical protein